jgi:hypothetical protein
LANAQPKFQVSALAGYQMLGKLTIASGKLDINDSEVYGAALTYLVRPDVGVELQYSFQPTQLSYEPFGSTPESVLYKMDVHYLQLGASYQREFNSKLTGFGGLSLGAVNFSPKSASISDNWKFAFAGTLGLKYFINPKFGIRLQAQGLFPVQWAGAGFFVGTGGVDFGVSAGTTIIQIATSAGLFFAF